MSEFSATPADRAALVHAIDRFLSYTPRGQAGYGYALGWATAQNMLLARLVLAGILTKDEAQLLAPARPDPQFRQAPRRGRPVGGAL